MPQLSRAAVLSLTFFFRGFLFPLLHKAVLLRGNCWLSVRRLSFWTLFLARDTFPFIVCSNVTTLRLSPPAGKAYSWLRDSATTFVLFCPVAEYATATARLTRSVSLPQNAYCTQMQ